MKIKPAITIVSMLLLAAGCAEERGHESSFQDKSIAPSFSYGYTHEYASEIETPPASSNVAMAENPDVSGRFMAGGMVGEHPSPSHGAGYSAEGQLTSEDQSDIAIIDHVRDSLTQNPEIALIVPNIQIAANRGAVELNGTVQTADQKQQIELITKNASGVVAVNNQIKIIAHPIPTSTGASQLSPTGSAAESSDRLYQSGGAGVNSSTNGPLNPTSLPGAPDQIYPQGSTQNGNNP